MKKFIMVLVLFQSINSMEYQSNNIPDFSINAVANEWLTKYFLTEKYEQDYIIDYLRAAKKNENVLQENMQSCPNETLYILQAYFNKHGENYNNASDPNVIPAIKQFESVPSNKDYRYQIHKFLRYEAIGELSRKFELDIINSYIEPSYDVDFTISTILEMSSLRLNLLKACLRNIKLRKP